MEDNINLFSIKIKVLEIFKGYIPRRFITNISEKTQETITLNNAKIIISKVYEIQIDASFKLIFNNIEKIINDCYFLIS